MGRVVMNPGFKRDMGRPENSREWQRRASVLGLSAIRGYAPVRFGTLRANLYSYVHYDGTTTYVIYASPQAYSGFQEHGTGLYGPKRQWITPTTAKALRWIQSTPGAPGGPGGQAVFAKRVRGTPAKVYFYRGLADIFSVQQTRSYAATGGRDRPAPSRNAVG